MAKREPTVTENMVEWICIVLVIACMAHCQYRSAEAEAAYHTKVKIEELRIKNEATKKTDSTNLEPVFPSEKN